MVLWGDARRRLASMITKKEHVLYMSSCVLHVGARRVRAAAAEGGFTGKPAAALGRQPPPDSGLAIACCRQTKRALLQRNRCACVALPFARQCDALLQAPSAVVTCTLSRQKARWRVGRNMCAVVWRDIGMKQGLMKEG